MKSEFDHVAREKDSTERSLQQTSEELKQIRKILRHTEEQLHIALADADALRQERREVDSGLKPAQLMPNNPSVAGEVSNLKEQLRLRVEDIESKDAEVGTLRQKCTSLHEKATSLQALIEQHQSRLQTITDDFEHRLGEQQKQSRSALEKARNELRSLEGNNARLEREMEHAQKIASDLQAEKVTHEQDIERIRGETTNGLKNQSLKHQIEISDLKHQLEQYSQLAKQAESKLERAKAEQVRVVEIRDRENENKNNAKINQQILALESILHDQGPTALGQQISRLAAKARGDKKDHVERTPISGDSSTINPSLHAQDDLRGKHHGKSARRSQSPYEVKDSQESIEEFSDYVPTQANQEALGALEQVNKKDVSLRSQRPGNVEDTQEDEMLWETARPRGVSLVSETQRSSSPLSEAFSFAFPGSDRTGMRHKYEEKRSPLKEQSTNIGHNTRVAEKPTTDLVTQEPKKLRANTASRMAPPSRLSHYEHTSQNRKTTTRIAHSSMEKDRSTSSKSTRNSSPSFVDEHGPTAPKITYGGYIGKHPSSAAPTTASPPGVGSSNLKRKVSSDHQGPSSSTKKARGVQQPIASTQQVPSKRKSSSHRAANPQSHFRSSSRIQETYARHRDPATPGCRF